MGTTDAGKALYESLEALATRDGGLGSQDVDRLNQAIKRAIINPGGETARNLIRAVARYENVRSPMTVRHYADRGE